MIPKLQSRESTSSKTLKVYPNVLIKIPFEPLVMSKSLIENKLKEVFYIVQSETYKMFPEAVAEEILNRLSMVSKSLNFTSQKKSVAIYLSATSEKIYYLSTSVKEEVVVGKPFSVRNIFLGEEGQKTYLLLALTSKSARAFLGEPGKLSLQVINLPQQVAASSGVDSRDYMTSKFFLQKFVKHADDALGILLEAYSLPLILVATPETKKMFSRISHHAINVIEYIETKSEEITEEEVLTLLKPLTRNWENVRKKYLLQQIESAAYNSKLVAGIEEVWKTARQSRSKLLIIERNYFFPAYLVPSGPLLYKQNALTKNSIHIKDAVDDAIENVLRDGGNVEIVEDGVLDEYLHIALIKH